MTEQLEFRKLDTPERKRTYHFPSRSITVENVIAVCVRPSGSHRLETAGGLKYIIAPGWLAVELDMDAWTF